MTWDQWLEVLWGGDGVPPPVVVDKVERLPSVILRMRAISSKPCSLRCCLWQLHNKLWYFGADATLSKFSVKIFGMPSKIVPKDQNNKIVTQSRMKILLVVYQHNLLDSELNNQSREL